MLEIAFVRTAKMGQEVNLRRREQKKKRKRRKHEWGMRQVRGTGTIDEARLRRVTTIGRRTRVECQILPYSRIQTAALLKALVLVAHRMPIQTRLIAHQQQLYACWTLS
jgi:hypothetical protein